MKDKESYKKISVNSTHDEFEMNIECNINNIEEVNSDIEEAVGEWNRIIRNETIDKILDNG